MPKSRSILTPDNLALLQCIAETGSFAAAARHLGLVPSALTYRIRQIEDALDVLLFDRSARQARPTQAGTELLREGARLLTDMSAVAYRIQRVATGWEPQFTLAVDGPISPHAMLELAEAFYSQAPPTQLKLRDEILTGTLEALTSGRADLAIGVSVNTSSVAGLQQDVLGEIAFVFAVSPQHPLANAPEPLSDATLLLHRAIAVADSAQGSNVSMGLLTGQPVFTVGSMRAKLQAQLRGLGCGFLHGPIWPPACWSAGNWPGLSAVFACITSGIAPPKDKAAAPCNGGWHSCTVPPPAPPCCTTTIFKRLPG